LYGAGGDAVVLTSDGSTVKFGANLTGGNVAITRSGTPSVTDLLAADGATATTTVSTDANGQCLFWGPDEVRAPLYVSFGSGWYAILPTQAVAEAINLLDTVDLTDAAALAASAASAAASAADAAASLGQISGQVLTVGDLLAGQGAGVLARLPAGTDGQALMADSTQALGLRWGGIPSGTPEIQLSSFAGFASSDGPTMAAAIQAGIDAAIAAKAVLVIPPRPGGGKYNWTGISLNLRDGGVMMRASAPAGKETSDVVIKIASATFFTANGSKVTGCHFQDICFYSNESANSYPFCSSSLVWDFCTFFRCRWVWFNRVPFTLSRTQILWCFWNLLTGNTLADTDPLVRFAGSDSEIDWCFFDAYPDSNSATRKLVQFDSLSMCHIGTVYITPSLVRPFEIQGYCGGTTFDHIIVNGLTVKTATVGTFANRPAASSSTLGRLYRLTDTSDAGKTFRCNGASWDLFHDGSAPLPITGDETALPSAASYPNRFATTTSGGYVGGIRSFYSDGTQWRGPIFDSWCGQDVSHPPQYLGSDLGARLTGIKQAIRIGHIWTRAIAQFPASEAGALHVYGGGSGTIHIGSWTKEQIYGATDLASTDTGGGVARTSFGAIQGAARTALAAGTVWSRNDLRVVSAPSASDIPVNSTTLTAISTVYGVRAGETWRCTATLPYEGSTTGDAKVAITGPSGTTVSLVADGLATGITSGSTSSSVSRTVTTTNGGGAAVGAAGTGTRLAVLVAATATAGADGTLVLSGAQQTTDGTTPTTWYAAGQSVVWEQLS
jgi:hypothetical protein